MVLLEFAKLEMEGSVGWFMGENLKLLILSKDADKADGGGTG